MTNLYKADGHADDSVAAQSRTSGRMEFSLFQKSFLWREQVAEEPASSRD